MRQFLLVAAVTAATALGLLMTQPVKADKVSADQYGNLVIQSSTGYKRIIVGEGHRAEEVARAMDDAEAPDVVTMDNAEERDCYRPGVWLKGRSHMYGRSPNEDPPYMAPCR